MKSSNNGFGAAATALDKFSTGPAFDAANQLADLFESAGDRIANSLERAARSGELSFGSLAEAITRDFAKLAVDQLVTAPLEGLLSSFTGALGGALGGGKPSVTVNMNAPKSVGSSGPQLSGPQVASYVAQAVFRGQSRI